MKKKNKDIKTNDELFITESSVRSKYDEDKITKLIIVINMSSKVEELTCLAQLCLRDLNGGR